MIPEPLFSRQPNGKVRAELMIDGSCVSWLTIVPLVIKIGAAEVRMDGIAGVGTLEDQRMKGYSRRVLESAVEYMTEGDAAITMLYGISNFYHKFGYATAGPCDYVLLPDLQTNNELPPCWSVRTFTADDLPVLSRMYDGAIRGTSGPAVRNNQGKAWTQILMPSDELEGNECRVITDGAGDVRAYAWLANWSFCIRGTASRAFPNALVIGEPIADSPESATALLAACRMWAAEIDNGSKVNQAVLMVPPDSCVSAAAMRENARLMRDFESCGGSMVRTLDVKRFLTALLPEIADRLRTAGCMYEGLLRIRTDIGSATLLIEREGVSVVEDPQSSSCMVVQMPQYDLGRLALGAFPPDDVISRLAQTPVEQASGLLRMMFPLRNPHMYVPDRY